MWNPSHVIIVIQRAENLLIKGKNGTNNAFVTITLGKQSYRTSVKEKSGKTVVWKEECELKILDMENSASIVLTVYHKNPLGIDQFLGIAHISLSSFGNDEAKWLMPEERTTEWLKLEGKPGKQKGKEKLRGILEVEIGFLFGDQSQSQSLLQRKSKSSIEHFTGSLFGLNQKDRKLTLKTLATSLQKSVLSKRGKSFVSDEKVEEFGQVSARNSFNNSVSTGSINNLDPGVISDDEEISSRKSAESWSSPMENQHSTSALSITSNSSSKPHNPYLKNPQISISFCDDDSKPDFSSAVDIREEVTPIMKRKKSPKLGEIQNVLKDKRLSTSCVDFYLLSSPKPEKKFSSTLYLEADGQPDSPKKLYKLAKKLKTFSSMERREIRRTVIGCEAGEKHDEGTASPKSDYKNKNKEELIRMVADLQKKVNCVSLRVKDLEDYLDEILLRVMETVPKILEKS